MSKLAVALLFKLNIQHIQKLLGDFGIFLDFVGVEKQKINAKISWYIFMCDQILVFYNI